MDIQVPRDREGECEPAYMVIGIDLEGHKDVRGIWIGENESANSDEHTRSYLKGEIRDFLYNRYLARLNEGGII
nr:hypothetical protein [Brevibacillus reuszeri]